LPRLLLLGCAALALSVAVAPVASARAAASDVSVRGIVVNGSHGDAPASGQAIGLTMVAGGQEQQIATTTSGAGGTFTIDHVQADPSATYILTTDFAGGTFATGELTADVLAAQQTLRVYDTTSSDAGIAVTLATMVLGTPNQRTGRISIAENVTITNADSKAYVATIQPADGRPMNLLRFALPAGATNLVLGAGFATGQTVQAPAGFGLATTVPPGKSEFAFAFDLPYAGSSLTVPYKAVYAAQQVVALLPSNLHAVPADFAAKPSVQAAGTEYQVLERTGLGAGATAAFRLQSLPIPGETPYLSSEALTAVGVGLALLMALLLAVFLRRGALPALLGGVGAMQLPLRQGADSEQRRDDLLREHVALDQLRSAGKLDEAAYRERRERLRSELRALVAPEKRDFARASSAELETRADAAQAPMHQATGSEGRPSLTEAAKGGAR
jgi:hypothetical protein